MSGCIRKPNFLEAKVDRNGIVRWKSNSRVPPQEVLNEWEEAGFNFDMELSKATREAEFAAFAAEYRKKWRDRG